MKGLGDRTLTPEQAAAVESRSGPLFLYANAGSGKTSVLVERFVRAVREDAVDPGSILAITYTDKAAGELKNKIRERFIELGDRENARAAEGAYISTIHGFCSRILRTHALAAGIDPDYRVLDEAESGRLSLDAFDRALEVLLESSTEMLEIAAAYTPDRLQDMVVTVYGRLRSRGQTVPALPELERPPLPDKEQAKLEVARMAAAKELGGADTGAKVCEALDTLDDCGEYLAQLASGQLPKPADLDDFKVGRGANALKTSTIDGYRDARDALIHACRAFEAYDTYVMLRELLSLYGHQYTELKRDRGGLDFEDLELQARDLLQANAAICDRYRQTFAHIMVDEFQDTNPLQYSILELIQEDNLFTVGDELQSIYGFRHADVDVFRRRREDATTKGQAQSLAVNFRSRREVLDALNAGYSDVFGPDFVPLLEGRTDFPTPSGPCVELLVTDKKGWDDKEPEAFGVAMPKASKWRLAEARFLAHRVREGIDGKEFAPGEVAVLLRAKSDMRVYEKALEDLDIPTYVIGGRGYWSQQQVSDLLAYLTALINPADELALYGTLASPLVGATSDALVVIAHTAKRLRRRAWWVLEEAFCENGDGSDGLKELVPEEDRNRLDVFCKHFSEERQVVSRHSLETLIDRAFRRFDYDLSVLRMPAGERRMANVRKLMRLAREFESREGRNLRGFVDFVATQEVVQAVEGEAPVEAEGLDAVRIMTIHSAKGLEFPVVCLADLGRRSRGDRDALMVGEDGRVGLQLITLGGEKAAAMDLEDLKAAGLARQEEEEKRIFYVGMTRAQKQLIVSGVIDCEKWPDPEPLAEPLRWVVRHFVPDFETRFRSEEPDSIATRAFDGRPVEVRCVLNSVETLGSVLPEDRLAPTPAERPHAEDGAVPSSDLSEVQAPSAPMVNRLSYSSLGSYAKCGYRFYLERVLGLEFEAPGASTDGAPEEAMEQPGRDEMTGLLRGEIIHELLEKLDFASSSVPSREVIADLVWQHGARCSDRDVDGIAGLIEGFIGSDLCRRLATADSARKEVGFAFLLGSDSGKGEGIVVNGIVDVYAREGGKTLVVDYKSDRLNGTVPSELVERNYSTQRLVYALAALEGGASDVEVTYSFLERPAELVTATFSRDELEDLRRGLNDLAASLLTGDFSVSPNPHRDLCEFCPGRRTLCSWDDEKTMRPAIVGG